MCIDLTFGHLHDSISHRKFFLLTPSTLLHVSTSILVIFRPVYNTENKKNSVWYTGLKVTKRLVETCSNVLGVNRRIFCVIYWSEGDQTSGRNV